MPVTLPPRPLVYVAGPYAHENSAVVAERVIAHERAAAALAAHGMVAFSPVAMWGARARTWLPGDLASSRTFWMDQDLPILMRCDMLVILPLEGWTDSLGTADEIATAQSRRMPIAWLDPLPFKGVALGPIDRHRRWPSLRLSQSSWYLEEV